LGLRTATGQVYAVFQAIDPATTLPPADALTGFLPPEDGTGRGQGYFAYTASLRPGLPTGTQIRNVASAVFDVNPAITTDQVDDNNRSRGVAPPRQARNTIDSGAPASSVAALPAFSPVSFTVRWSGQDDAGGSGISAYNVLVSDNGGPFTLWQAAAMT